MVRVRAVVRITACWPHERRLKRERVQPRQRWGLHWLVLGAASVTGLAGRYGHSKDGGGDLAASCWVLRSLTPLLGSV